MARLTKSLLFVVCIFTLVTLGAASAVADSVWTMADFYNGPNDFQQLQDSDTTAPYISTSFIRDARFGTIASEAYIDGNELKGYVGTVWLDPFNIPNEYVAQAKAFLQDSFWIEGSGTGSVTMTIPVSGSFENNDYWTGSADFSLRTGDSESTVLQFWPFKSNINTSLTYVFENVPFSSASSKIWTSFSLEMWLYGGNVKSGPVNGYVDFMHTAEVTITRITQKQNDQTVDVPLTNLKTESGRDFTSDPPASVPEPTSLLLFGTGLGVIGLAAWRKKK